MGTIDGRLKKLERVVVEQGATQPEEQRPFDARLWIEVTSTYINANPAPPFDETDPEGSYARRKSYLDELGRHVRAVHGAEMQRRGQAGERGSVPTFSRGAPTVGPLSGFDGRTLFEAEREKWLRGGT